MKQLPSLSAFLFAGSFAGVPAQQHDRIKTTEAMSQIKGRHHEVHNA